MKIKNTGSSFTSILAMGAVVTIAAGCAPKAPETEDVSLNNLIQAGDPKLSKTIGDQQHTYSIISKAVLKDQLDTGNLQGPNSRAGIRALDASVADMSAEATPPPNGDTSDSALVFGLPMDLLNKPMIFGSVVTEVSDKTSEDLGNLKLSDFGPFHVVPKARKTSTQTYVSLMLCKEDCSKLQDADSLINIPVMGVDAAKQVVYIDMAKLGQKLDLSAIRHGDPAFSKFKPKASKTVRFDFSKSTLVFDVEAHLIDQKASETDTQVAETVITNRWFLRTTEGFNPQFVSREATPGVGFFMTRRGPKKLIQRWDLDAQDRSNGVKYYIKNVPQEYQGSFASAFDEWNDKLYPIVGKKMFSYEFVDASDPRSKAIVAGDIRYNVMEWDLVNKASYGGLGPSLANQFTGEIFHADVLIQGPTVVELYSKWFKVQKEAATLRAAGQAGRAELMLARAQAELRQEMKPLNSRTFEMSFGEGLKMRINAQEPSYEDPTMLKDDFDQVPQGYDYSTYMAGYFHDMVAHELGHNLGLRHNFKGNLGAHDKLELGGVSRSIMEYLGRGYRYLDLIGEYDLMAISYGYAGVKPAHLDWFCTDEDAANLTDPSRSAECTPNDATHDPYGFFLKRLSHAIDLAVAKGSPLAPEWTLADLKEILHKTLVGLGSYGASASQTSSSWTNFFSTAGRPTQANEIKGYVLQTVKSVLCDPTLEGEIASKSSEEARMKTSANLQSLRNEVEKTLGQVFSSTELSCSSSLN